MISCSAKRRDSSGYTVPHRVAKAMPSRSRLLTRKADSRESIESRRWPLRMRSYRQKKMASGTITPKARNSRNTQPSVDAPKEWTDGTGPPRFMNMP